MKAELYNGINDKFKLLQGWLNDNAGKARLSTIYESDKYIYDYYNWKIGVNTEQLLIQTSEKNVIYGFKGDIDSSAA
jgi:hypothetical protein